MRRIHVERWLAGALLAVAQTAIALVRGRDLFLSPRELLEFALATLFGLGASAVAVGALLDPALRATPWPEATRDHPTARRTRLAYALIGAGLGAWLGWLLSAGRRVRDLPLRPVGVALFALALAAALWLWLWLAVRIAGTEPLARRAWRVGMGLCALACLVLDALVLPRGYPAFHGLLLGVALVAVALAPTPTPTRSGRALGWAEGRRARVAAPCVLAAAPLSLWLLAQRPNASYAVLESASFTAKLLRPFLPRATATATPAAVAAEPETPVTRGVDLRDRDVLLITVDALRADLLRAWGGSGVTPELDKLAAVSLRFRRAYTAAPHTSYSLASLLTAKFVKPVTELGSARDHATLPDLLRRYGYRTAAFYPPAVFFVDGARFSALQERGFGFEYRKEMFASAEQRVGQLAEYLAQAEARPLFLWVHLFEPHEPYEPPAELVTLDSARGRYEGEVRACDRAIARLVQVFRASRPRGSVIVSADHGEEFGDHGGSYHGSTLFDEQVRVPLLWSAPGVIEPGDSDAPVELVDVGSTILSTAGIPRDARMRGDDLSGVLARTHPGPRLAFASVEERHMVTDGRYKAICSASQAHCQLFDLTRDPRERHNLAGEEPERAAQLRAELFAFLSSIAKREVVGVEQGVGFPEPLVRARLNAPGAGPDVLPLLDDPRVAVRAASARILGELQIQAARPRLTRLRAEDADASVRDEAAVAALLLGDVAAREAVAALLTREGGGEGGLTLQRRAALALASLRDERAIQVLSGLLGDAAQQESERLRAVTALRHIGSKAGVPALIAALAEVRLREAAAQALGAIGGDEARAALLTTLQDERYEPARAAEAEALVQLGDKRVVAAIQRFLGMETSLPGGVQLLQRLNALEAAGAHGGALLPPAMRRGSWQCGERGCAPGPDAVLVVAPLASGARRLTLSFDAAPNALVELAGNSVRAAGGPQQISVLLERGQRELPVRSEGQVHFGAWVAVRAQAEIPPPEPEPWDAGPDAASGG
ncbi:MAG TPA: sulfatase-like hydrolase/transferase [Polyangiales bacterium]